jgi:hypothetical protein
VSSSSPVDKIKKKKSSSGNNNNNDNNNDDDLLDAAKIALSVSPSTSPRSLKSNSNDYDVDSDTAKLTKNPLTLKPAPRLVKESGITNTTTLLLSPSSSPPPSHHYPYHHYNHLGSNESRLEQLLKQNNELTKWSDYKKHDRLFESRNILNRKGRNSNDSHDDYNISTNRQTYDDIEEKDIEKYKPPLPPRYKNKDDDDPDSKIGNKITKSIFRTASNVIKNGLSTRRSWDSRSPSPVGGDNSDTRSNNSDKSNASVLSKSSTNSTTRGRLLGVKKRNDITIYPTDNDEDLDVSYI